MEETRIPLSKRKIGFLILASAVFVLLGFWLMFFMGGAVVILVSAADIAFFGACGIYGCLKFFDNRPGLIINSDGIIDNSSATSAGLIRWRNITNLSVVEIQHQKILRVGVNNAEEILSKQTGLKKTMMKLNNRFYGSPVQISSNDLKCNFQELLNLVRKRLEELP